MNDGRFGEDERDKRTDVGILSSRRLIIRSGFINLFTLFHFKDSQIVIESAE